MGTLYSITDYGDYKRFSKKSLIDKMRKSLMGEPDESGISHHVQYIDVVDKKTGDIANKLVISTSRSGYSVIPVFGETTAKKPDLFATFMEERAMKQGVREQVARLTCVLGLSKQGATASILTGPSNATPLFSC